MNMIWHHHDTKPSDTKLTGFILFYWSQAEYAKSRNQWYEQNQHRMRFWHSSPVGVPPNQRHMPVGICPNQRRMRFWAFGGYECHLDIPRVAFCIG